MFVMLEPTRIAANVHIDAMAMTNGWRNMSQRITREKSWRLGLMGSRRE
jgi:hypothetical protein